MAPTPCTVLPTPDAIGEYMAERILSRVAQAAAQYKRFLLGCPTGRTPKPIFGAMARRLREERQSLRHVVLVLMDEYLVPRDGTLAYASSDEPWSCHYFARVEIAGRLNAVLPAEQQIADDATWFPDPNDPPAYDARIAAAGGIDFFLLASGGSDGHVAFNPPGAPRESRTRIIPLSEETRRDNLQTFPVFGSLENVPHHGVSVGIDTIVESAECAMVVWGSGKQQTLSRMRAVDRYTPEWPATLIFECRAGEIVADIAAAAAIQL
ncbi:MAG: 6-phosphogluconolactonase [Gemmatimonadaceae bacterium]